MIPNQKKIKELGELKPQEADLIHLIRTKYQFGEISVLCRDGLPVDIIKTVERIRLGKTFEV